MTQRSTWNPKRGKLANQIFFAAFAVFVFLFGLA